MTTKLWEKEKTRTPEWLIEFTAGKDAVLDLQLAEFDVQGSLAHVSMLGKVGLISATESAQLQDELNEILQDIKAGNFKIEAGVEDIHSQVELILTKRLGDVGKKVHTARSRNDQVLLDIKLYIRHQLKETVVIIEKLFELLIGKSEVHKHVLMPGYTHFQAAMPSSFGLWFGAYAESLCDDLEIINAAYHVADKNPLGSGAGYGSSLPIDRADTTKQMGFGELNYNVVYAQMTRGKVEKIAAMALANVASTLSRMATDICLFNSQNFEFLFFPDELTTGSSIMPHKKNPDVFELIRAKCNRIQSVPNELSLLMNNLPSGYHRDLQLTKEILFPVFNDIKCCIEAAINMLLQVKINEGILKEEKYKLLFTVEAVNELVLKGVPFREAYKQVGVQVSSETFEYDQPLCHTHEGSMGNLCNDQIKERFVELKSRIVK